MQKYVSRLMTIDSATITEFTKIPLGGVCLVISLCPTIFSARGQILEGLEINGKITNL